MPKGMGSYTRMQQDSPVPLTCCVTGAVTHPLYAWSLPQEVMWAPVGRVFWAFPCVIPKQTCQREGRTAGVGGVLGNTPACPSGTSEGRSQSWNQICPAPGRWLQWLVLLVAGAAGSGGCTRSSCEPSSDAPPLHNPWERRAPAVTP